MRFFHDIVSASIAFVPLCVGYDRQPYCRFGEKRTGLSWTQIRMVFQGTCDLHAATSREDRDRIVGAVLQEWEREALSSKSMAMFVKHATEWWVPAIRTKFPGWQICFTKVGSAATSNAVEHFSSVIKSESGFEGIALVHIVQSFELVFLPGLRCATPTACASTDAVPR